ncbi:MAG: 2Fe-2S iron-sulfur cluster-binding protein [Gammaproteobacteria bacterium]|nr:2Fe-2S iron-sulfur cluster-binding protein [Gammaproteobacteria bacterium]
MGKIFVTDREGNSVEVDGQEGVSVMEILRDLDNSVEGVCGGLALCATCHCFIEPEWLGKLDDRGEDEAWLLEGLDNFDSERSRLTCQIPYTDEFDGLTLIVAPEE